MTATRRRPLKRDHLDIESTLRRFADLAPEMELGWSVLRHEMADAGWTATTPTGDRKHATPQVAIQCRTCEAIMFGSAAKDEHKQRTGHDLFAYTTPNPTGGSSLDYFDPTGELGLSIDRLSDDLFDIQTLWRDVTKALAMIAQCTRRYVPDAVPGVPACAVETCDGIVEMTSGGKGYRGMDLIAGHWVAKPGHRPVCARHRSVERRGAA